MPVFNAVCFFFVRLHNMLIFRPMLPKRCWTYLGLKDLQEKWFQSTICWYPQVRTEFSACVIDILHQFQSCSGLLFSQMFSHPCFRLDAVPHVCFSSMVTLQVCHSHTFSCSYLFPQISGNEFLLKSSCAFSYVAPCVLHNCTFAYFCIPSLLFLIAKF